MISLGSVTWGSGPSIPISFEYEKKRSGADMQYRVKVTIASITGGSYFGYPIYLGLTIDGKSLGDTTLKSASPATWSSAIAYTSPWYTVSGKTSGTTPVSFRVYSGSGSSRNNTYTYSMGVDPAASLVSAPNGTLATKLSLTVTRYNTGFTHTITYKCGTETGEVCSKSTASSVDWVADNGNTLALASQNTSGQTVSVTFTITTYNGTSVVGTNATTVTMTIPVVKPSVSLDVEDAAGYLATYGAYVQGWSKLKITATPTLAYGSPIKTYVIVADGKGYSTTPVTTDEIQSGENLVVTAKVTDNRSNTSDVASENIPVLAYSKPAVTAIAYRCNSSGEEDPEGAYMRIGFTATITSLNDKNSATYNVTCGSHKFSGSGTSYLSEPVECDVSQAWPVEVKISDDLDSTTKAAVIPIAFTLMDFYYTGLGVAFGKVGTRDGFDCAMPAYFTGGVYIGEQALTDYIVEHGSENGLTWRKWSSGVAECWGTIHYENHPEYGVLGDGSYAQTDEVSLPFAFANAPCATFTASCGSGFAYPARVQTTVDTVTWFLAANQEGVDVNIHLQVVGRWK